VLVGLGVVVGPRSELGLVDPDGRDQTCLNPGNYVMARVLLRNVAQQYGLPLSTVERALCKATTTVGGGQVHAPGEPSDPIQLIGAQDVAPWTILLQGRSITGTCYAVSLAPPSGFGQMLETDAAKVGPPGTHLTWVDSFAFQLAVALLPHLPVDRLLSHSGWLARTPEGP
jgi:hypothetical protein